MKLVLIVGSSALETDASRSWVRRWGLHSTSAKILRHLFRLYRDKVHHVMAGQSADPGERLQPCFALHDSGIPCVVWFEDAIAHYGVPTVLFKLYILVPDIDTAAQELTRRGWVLTPQQAKVGNAEVEQAMRHLEAPDYERGTEPPGTATTVLLSAADWNYNLPNKLQIPSNSATFFPPLPYMLDALIDSLLDAPSSNIMLQRHLACQIAYLYAHVPALREPSFAGFLKLEHRQYRSDTLSGMNTGNVKCIAHQHNSRDAIRQGTYELRECSASQDNEDLFTEKREARLLTTLPPPLS